MENDIIKFLKFNPNEVTVTNIEVDSSSNTKFIYVEKPLQPVYCPVCNARMHSKGFRTRKLNYPILQDGYATTVCLKYRRFECTNPVCQNTCTEEFSFAQRYKHNINTVPYMILNDLKDLNVTARMAADRYNVSDTYVHNVVLQYLNCDRLPLPEILSVDEVHLDFNKNNKYALVLFDFTTGTIIDILPNRLKKEYEDYFFQIPYEERKKVKVIVCDMYNPYVNFAPAYFPNALVVVDSFHVVQWIINKINLYINDVKKKYQKRDNEIFHSDGFNENKDFKNHKVSKEVYLLTHFRWILLASKENINYHTTKKWYSALNMSLDSYQIESMFLELDPKFKEIRRLKEIYIEFNNMFPMDSDKALERLNEIISIYRKSDLLMFREFSQLLTRYKIEIANSFIDPRAFVSKKYEKELATAFGELRRISNGPIESQNRPSKSLKRDSRGFENITYTIFRLIWTNRKNEAVLAEPKKEKEIHTYTGKKRGPYKKHNK